MHLVKFPRGREHARAIDAAPVPDPHGPGYDYTQGHYADHDDGLLSEPRHPMLAEASASTAQVADGEWVGWKATDEIGRTVGRIEAAVEGEWLVVRDRRGHHLLAPATEAIAGGASVFLPYDHDLIASAPQLDDGDDGLDPEIVSAAREHYSRHSLAH